jgi:hypothetical protein
MGLTPGHGKVLLANSLPYLLPMSPVYSVTYVTGLYQSLPPKEGNDDASPLVGRVGVKNDRKIIGLLLRDGSENL